MDVDPLASMRCWAIEIELGGRTYEVPALPAVEWWPVLVSRDLGLILDFVESSPDDPFNLDDLLLQGSFTGEEMTTALTDALEETAGRSFHSAFVLATVTRMHWSSINGTLARHGFRWDVMPLGAALDAVYAEITGRLDKEELAKFLTLLDDESISQPGKKRKPSERVAAEFESMAGPKPTTGVVATAERSGSERSRTRQQRQQPRQVARSNEPKQRRALRAGNGLPASS